MLFTAIIVLTATFLLWLVELHVWIAFSVTPKALTLFEARLFRASIHVLS